jgi:hypothetical protein
VASKIRNLLLALPLALAACGTSAPTPAPTPTSSAAAANANGAGGGFTIYEGGGEHDACGIGVVVKFPAGVAVVLGGPVGHVPDQVTSADALPANGARAVAGDPVTVAGKRFMVNAIDPAGRRVQLEPQC